MPSSAEGTAGAGDAGDEAATAPAGSRRALTLASAAAWAAHVLLGAGLLGPCMTVIPRMGRLTGLGEWLGLVDGPRTFSVFGGVRQLLLHGNLPIGLLLLVFSVLFPTAKLVLLRGALVDLREARRPHPAHAWTAHLGKFSMVDVFVLSLMVLASKTFPGGTSFEVEWGAWAFAGAALIPPVLSVWVGRAHRRLERP